MNSLTLILKSIAVQVSSFDLLNLFDSFNLFKNSNNTFLEVLLLKILSFVLDQFDNIIFNNDLNNIS